MEFKLLRRIVGQSEWKSTTQGNASYIATVFELNLKSPELKEFEWKIVPVQ